jgi:hypothetical protein
VTASDCESPRLATGRLRRQRRAAAAPDARRPCPPGFSLLRALSKLSSAPIAAQMLDSGRCILCGRMEARGKGGRGGVGGRSMPGTLRAGRNLGCATEYAARRGRRATVERRRRGRRRLRGDAPAALLSEPLSTASPDGRGDCEPLGMHTRPSSGALSALSSVENVEPEADERRFHKEIFLLTINNRKTRFWVVARPQAPCRLIRLPSPCGSVPGASKGVLFSARECALSSAREFALSSPSAVLRRPVGSPRLRTRCIQGCNHTTVM